MKYKVLTIFSCLFLLANCVGSRQARQPFPMKPGAKNALPISWIFTSIPETE